MSKTKGEILRDAYDDFWQNNPPAHAHGTPEYYKWYEAQNEFVFAAIQSEKISTLEAKLKVAREGLLSIVEGESAYNFGSWAIKIALATLTTLTTLDQPETTKENAL